MRIFNLNGTKNFCLSLVVNDCCFLLLLFIFMWLSIWKMNERQIVAYYWMRGKLSIIWVFWVYFKEQQPQCGISYENLAKSPFMKLLINFFNFESSNLILSDEQKKIDTFRQNFVGIDVWICLVDTYSKPLFNLK